MTTNARRLCRFIPAVVATVLAGAAAADTVTYTLENVVMSTGGAVMTGEFDWTYTPGDFENGTGVFTSLAIPYTSHDQTDLDITIDVGSSVEFTLVGNFHDDGVDITLFLLEPLTPTTPAAVDLARSKYDIGGNGFITGGFLSGSIAPLAATGVALPLTGTELSAGPNPFRSSTTVTYAVRRAGPVRVSVHDIAGRTVRNLAQGWRPAGRYSVTWDAPGAAPGVYLVRFDSAGDSETRRVVLIR